MSMSPTPRYSIPLKVRRRRRPAARHDALSHDIRMGACDCAETPSAFQILASERHEPEARELKAFFGVDALLQRRATRKYLAWSHGVRLA